MLGMDCMSKSIVNCVSMATNGCLTSVPSPLTASKPLFSQSHIAIPAKPLRVQVSCSYSSCLSTPCLFSLKKQKPIAPVAAIAAQQEENNPVLLEEQGYEGSFNWGEPENETGEQNENGGEAGEGYTFAEPSEELKVYVGNLPYDVDSEGLAKLFEEAGVVEVAEVIYNRDTDRSRGFGFVTMSTPEETERAVQMFHRYDLGGRFLTVSKAAPKGSRFERPPGVAESSNRIYVGNLSWSISENRLEQLFSEHGKVVSARVVSDRETGRSRGFGFVVMATEADMNDAIANLDGQNLDGRAIRVNVAQDRPRRGSF